MQEESRKLSGTTVGLMIATAIFFDILQAVLTVVFLGWLVGFFAFLTFYVWFKMKGLSFSTPKRALTMTGATIIEIIPFLSILPAWTLAIILLTTEAKVKEVVSEHIPGAKR